MVDAKELAREVVHRTPSEKDAVLLVFKDGTVGYASPAQYGRGYILKPPRDDILLAFYCYAREPSESSLDDLPELKEAFEKFKLDVSGYGKHTFSVTKMTYHYYPCRVEVKKKTDRYAIIDIDPDTSKSIVASAYLVDAKRAWTRKGKELGFAEEEIEKFKMAARSLGLEAYIASTGKRSETWRIKVVTDASKVEEVLREVLGGRAEERVEEAEEEEVEEEVSLEEVLAGWGLAPSAPAAPERTAVPEEEEEEKEEEHEEEVFKVTEEIVQRFLARQGLQRVKLVVFELPTEYKGAKKTYERDEQGRYIEKVVFNGDTAEYRTLRRQFYDALKRVAWRSPMGWVAFRGADLTTLNEVIKKLNELAGTARVVSIFECYLPRHELELWLSEWIVEKKMDLEKLNKKLAEEIQKEKERKRIKKEMERLREYLRRLEEELKSLRGAG